MREWVNINLEDLEFLLLHAGQVRSGAQSAGFRGGAQSFRTLTLFSRLMGKARAYLNCSIPFGSRQLRSSSTTRTRGAKPCAVVAFLQEHARTACSFASIHKRAQAKSTYEKTAQTSRKQQLSVLVQFWFHTCHLLVGNDMDNMLSTSIYLDSGSLQWIHPWVQITRASAFDSWVGCLRAVSPRASQIDLHNDTFENAQSISKRLNMSQRY